MLQFLLILFPFFESWNLIKFTLCNIFLFLFILVRFWKIELYFNLIWCHIFDIFWRIILIWSFNYGRFLIKYIYFLILLILSSIFLFKIEFNELFLFFGCVLPLKISFLFIFTYIHTQALIYSDYFFRFCKTLHSIVIAHISLLKESFLHSL